MGRFGMLLVLVGFAAACGAPTTLSGGAAATDPPADSDAGQSSAVCAPDTPDCVDMVVEPADDEPLTDKQYRQGARSLLEVAEADLPPDVRIGRRGDEQMALTEDYRVGRMTVALDQDIDGVYRVTEVTVELDDGPVTFSADR